jgi:hypothetical protein
MAPVAQASLLDSPVVEKFTKDAACSSAIILHILAALVQRDYNVNECIMNRKLRAQHDLQRQRSVTAMLRRVLGTRFES